VKGAIAVPPLLARNAEKTGEKNFRLGPWGFVVVSIEK